MLEAALYDANNLKPKMIPPRIYSKLEMQNALREDVTETKAALSRLPTPPKQDFVEFFECFNGPLGSDGNGYQILDIIDEEPSVVTATEQLHQRFGLPKNYLVISNLLAQGVLIYSCHNDAVYDVDFEGGLDLLLQNQLLPRWHSFSAFLSDYFGLTAC